MAGRLCVGVIENIHMLSFNGSPAVFSRVNDAVYHQLCSVGDDLGIHGNGVVGAGNSACAGTFSSILSTAFAAGTVACGAEHPQRLKDRGSLCLNSFFGFFFFLSFFQLRLGSFAFSLVVGVVEFFTVNPSLDLIDPVRIGIPVYINAEAMLAVPDFIFL